MRKIEFEFGMSQFLVSLEDKADEIKSNIKQIIISHMDSLHGKFVHHVSAE